jgi:O-antigen/teichoic acid export membrane protein
MSLKINSLYTAGSGILRFVVGVATAPLLIWKLGLREFGIFSVLISVVSVTTLIELDVSTAVINYLAGDRARNDDNGARETLSTSWILITALALIGAGAMFGLSWLLIPKLFKDVDLRAEGLLSFQILAGSVIFRLWKNWQCAVEAGLQRYDAQTWVELPAALVMQAGSVGVAILRPSATWVVGWQCLVIAASCVAHFFVIRNISPPELAMSWKFSVPRARQQLHFGLGQWAGDIGSALFNNADRLIVNGILGPAATGVYSAAVSVVNKILDIPVMFIRILPPAVSAARAIGDTGRIRYLLIRAIRVNCAVAFAVGAGAMFWADLIARFMLGAQNTPDAAMIIRIMAVVYSFFSACLPACSFAGGLGYPMLEAKWLLSGAAVMCPLMYVLTRRFGLPGAAWANAGFLVTTGIAVRVAQLTGLRLRRIVHELSPFVAGMSLLALFTMTRAFQHLPLWARIAMFILTIPVGSVWIFGRDSVRGFDWASIPTPRGIRNLVLARRPVRADGVV